MEPVARLTVVALDCRSPRELAEFYSAVTGWTIGKVDDDWIELASDGAVTIAFQLAPDHQPPDWPGDEHPQQLHLDFDVDDLDAGEAAVLALGATRASAQPDPEWRVFLDPAGHPFCLVLADS